MADFTCSVPGCAYKCTRLYKGMCSTHYQRQRKGDPINGRPRAARAGICDLCGDAFEALHASRRYCSEMCLDAKRHGYSGPLTCRACDKRMHATSTSLPQGEAECLSCRRATHGERGYMRGCRCDVCRQGKADAMRAWMEAFRAEQGVSYATAWRRKFRAEHGYWPQRHGGQWIAHAERMAIYERDDWMCHLCGERVDADAEFNDDMAASLDHLVPRSLGGSDDPTNLKTAHRGCNTRRGAKLLEEVAA